MNVIWYRNYSGQTEEICCYCTLSAAAIWDALKAAGFHMMSTRP